MCTSSAGAANGNRANGTARYATSARTRYNHAPRNLPIMISRSRTDAESNSSRRPETRSSATSRIVRTAASTGRTGAADTAHNTVIGVRPPSPSSSECAKRPPATARNTAIAMADERDPANAPNVREKITSIDLMPTPGLPRWRLPARATVQRALLTPSSQRTPARPSTPGTWTPAPAIRLVHVPKLRLQQTSKRP